MILYADSSAMMKRYVDEPDSAEAQRTLASGSMVATSRLTLVEVRRNLARVLNGSDLLSARALFLEDLRHMALVELDQVVCEMAAATAEATGARSSDALHIASARRLGEPDLGFVTYDIRQAVAARAVGLTVLGA